MNIFTKYTRCCAVFASNFFCVMNSKDMHLNHVNWCGKHRDENVQVSIAVLAQACINKLKFRLKKWLVESKSCIHENVCLN